jgi:hypothetical protein
MATNDSINTTRASQLTPDEMRGLAQRLRARADSVILRDQPEMQRDLHAAALAIERLLKLDAVIRATEPLADRLHSLFELMRGR